MSANTKNNLFESIAKGWREIEPVVVTNLALKKPIILEGTHGICKSTLGREVSRIFGENACRCYDATKDDLVSIASVPIPDELAKGNLVFSRHNRSIWEAKVVYIDELMRANKENQNLWLEILEERTLFGQPLQYEMVIATQNPEGYASNFELDEALLDRFTVVVPVPNLQKAKSDTIKEVIALNVSKRNGNITKKQGLNVDALKEVVDSVRDSYNDMVQKEALVDVICTFVSEFIELLLKVQNESAQDEELKLYISPRRWTHLTEEIIGMYAYRVVTNGLESKQDKIKALEDSAYWSIYYSIATVLKVDMEMLNNVFKKVKVILSEFELTEADKFRLTIMKKSEDREIIDFLKENAQKAVEILPNYELKMIVGKLISSNDKADSQLSVYELCRELNISVYEAMGSVVEVMSEHTGGYYWNKSEESLDENRRRACNGLKIFPPSEETYKSILKMS